VVRFSKNFFFLLYIAAITATVAYGPFIDSDLTVFVFVVVGWMLSLGLHEFGHAFVAWKSGDYTMPGKGYLAIDPLRYADPFNSIVFPVLIILLGGIGLPGASVYIERSLIRTRAQLSLMSAAGPIMNLIVLGLLSIPFALGLPGTAGSPLLWSAVALLAFFQATAVVLNLIPLPGLDGFGVLAPWLPASIREAAERLGAFLVLGLFVLIMAVPQVARTINLTSLYIVSFFGIDPTLIFIGISKFRFWENMF
jgi:Zn-dependent protease